MELEKLLKPRTVAIVGASEKAVFGGDTTRNYLKFSENLDRLYLVNPGRDAILGRRVYHSLSEIEGDVDLVILCTPQKTIIPLLEEAAKKNCGGAVVFARGYSETGAEGRVRQQELIEAADRLGIAVMGPNCAGFANFVDGIFAYAFLVEERDRKGNIGMISQSGQIVLGGLDTPGMGFSHVISSGNSCNVKVEDYLDFLVEDEDTKVVAAYMEGVARPEKLTAVFQKAALKKKPVIVLKTGRSAKSQELAASHTGSLSGADKVLRAIFKRYGVVEAGDLEELMSLAAAFSWLEEMPKGERCVFMNVSGGEAGVMADLAEEYKIPLAKMEQKTRDYLSTLVPDYGSVNNPFDMTAGIGYNTFIEHTRHQESADTLKAAGVPLLPTGRYGCSALKKILEFAASTFEPMEPAIPERKHEKSHGLSEFESLNYLKAHGVPVPDQAVAATIDEAVEAAGKLGYPLSVKIHSADIRHKSDVGGVKLNIKDETELREAFASVMENCKKNAPEAALEGVLLKPMLKAGTEMIVGVNNDRDFGPMIMVGMGGVFVELFQDVQLAPAPLTQNQAEAMIGKLASCPLLNGYRGGAVCDKKALANLLVKISQMAAAGKETIKELDINPVFVTENGAEIADALLILYDD